MAAAAVDTALEVANWFFKRAEKEGDYLEDDKLHHLMFLSQIHFAVANHDSYLFPAIFAAGPDGYFEPNLKMALSFGRPLMASPTLNQKVNSFLEVIWSKYASLTFSELSNIIRNSTNHAKDFHRGHPNLVPFAQLVNYFKNQSATGQVSSAPRANKVLISQNGPVVVSQWQPRKINSTISKENTNA